MRVALYLRRSTVDLQPDSLAAQEELLRAFASQNGHEVVRCYRDSASGCSVAGRDAFQELIETAKAGPDFSAVLVRDVSRWSRAPNTDEAGYYEFVCRSHGVQVLYVEETFGQDSSPYSLLLKSVKRAMAAEFSRDRSRMVVQSQARLVREGFWPTGCVPYAMQRVLVDRTGAVIRVLVHGDRKALASQRVKLAPGDPAQIAVVRRIFETYVSSGGSVDRVVGELNRGGIPSSKGRSWTAGMVSHVLRNEAYAGNLVYRVHGGELRSRLRSLEGSSSDRIIRCEGAHEAIIGSEVWRVAQERLRANSTRQTDEDLLNALRTARTRWHISQSERREVVTAADLREGYGRPDVKCIGKAAPRALAALRDALRSGSTVDKLEDGWLIDHLLHVGFRVSFPHARFGGLHWRFQFTGGEREDVILGLGFSPPPCVRHVETYFFRATRWRQSEARPPVAAVAARGQYRRIGTVEDLERALNHAIRFRNKRAEDLFRNAVRSEAKLSLASVADRLCWPVGAARKVYRTLELRGETLPPLSNGTVGVKVRMTCPHCLRVRSLAPKVAVSLETDVCFECLHRAPVRTPNKLVAICPKCGSRRLLYPSDVAARSAGLETQCRACSLADGRRKGVEAWRARRGLPR